MEAIQINVSVELNVSQDTKNFISSLFKSNLQGAPLIPAKPAPAPEKPIASASAKPAPAPEKPIASASEPTITIEQVRKALAAKINEHREEIKSKLNSLGSPSVTKLDPVKYPEMLTFLNSL